MCECLCSVVKGDIALKTGDAWITVDAYTGCEDCARLVGIDVHVFTAQGAMEFASEQPFAHVEPDDYGGPRGGVAACFELFSMDDLAEAALLLGFRVPDSEYDDWRGFMYDFGLKWMRAARTICEVRKRQEQSASTKPELKPLTEEPNSIQKGEENEKD